MSEDFNILTTSNFFLLGSGNKFHFLQILRNPAVISNKCRQTDIKINRYAHFVISFCSSRQRSSNSIIQYPNILVNKSLDGGPDIPDYYSLH